MQTKDGYSITRRWTLGSTVVPVLSAEMLLVLAVVTGKRREREREGGKERGSGRKGGKEKRK